MKKFSVAVIFAVVMITFGIGLTGCAKHNNFGWRAIAEATIAETTKADANFKITTSYIGVADVVIPPQYTIIDGNKIKNDNEHYYAKYLHFENGNIWYYLDHEEIWYKSPQVVVGDIAPYPTLWETQVNDSALGVLKGTLSNIKDVKNIGKNKYTYRLVADYFMDVAGYWDYTFITDGTRVTEIQIREKSHTITYGGQSVTLPDAIEPTKLIAPQNLKIMEGILSWDLVEGAENPWKGMEGTGKYYVKISKDNSYIGAAYVESESYDLHKRLLSQDWITNGTYQITVKAYPTIFLNYQSDESTPITYVFVR